MITGDTRLYALIGNPVDHSLSPFIMNRAFDAAGIDARYVTMPAPAAQLATAVDGLRVLRAGGANVTYPYKERIVDHIDRVAGDARRIGAVNTLVCGEAGIAGHNTDATGVVTALERFADVTLGGREVYIFGSGGSARAAAWGALVAGASAVTFASREPARAGERVAPLRDYFRASIDCVPTDNRIAFEVADVVINATPVGMGGDGGSPLADPAWIHSGQVCFDFVYHPRRTPFLEAAARQGAKTVDGIALLVSQAAASFEHWTGAPFDPVEMARAVAEPDSGGRR
jgi:shikimate dehydrogenase